MDYASSECSPETALTACRGGECFLVQAVRGDAAARLRDVGLREGALVTVVRNSGDLVVRVACSRVCLRREIAHAILGTPVAG